MEEVLKELQEIKDIIKNNRKDPNQLLTAEELSEETGIPVNNMRKLFNDKDLAVQTYTRPRKVTRYAWNEFIKERR